MTCFAGIDVSPRSVSMCIEDRHVHAVCVRRVPIEYFPGSVVAVETDMTNIGTRTHTLDAVAESMSVPVHRVLARLGDSACPVSASLGGAVGGQQLDLLYAACMKLCEAVMKVSIAPGDAESSDGIVCAGDRAEPLAVAAGTNGLVARTAAAGAHRVRALRESFGEDSRRYPRQVCRGLSV